MINTKQIYDYSRLLGRMREKGYTQLALAKALKSSETTVNFKLNNKRPFKQDEMLVICKVLGIPLEQVEDYFFPIKL